MFIDYKDSLLAVYPIIAREWHPTKNGDVTPADVHNGSSKIVWWQCPNDHEYQKSVGKRTKRNQGCPICRLEKRSIATKHPDLVCFWDYDKNGDITPESCFAGSDYKVWWKCEKGHSYQMQVNNKTNGYGCPICSSQKLSDDNCLAITEPRLASEWHPTKNGNLTPNDVMRASHKDVWWKCERGHEWHTPVYSRLTHGCPICDAEKRTSFPEQAILFYFSKNYETKSREKVNGWEVDVFVPELKLAIEYDGHYFHSSEKSKEREKRKDKALIDAGLLVIHIKETKDILKVEDTTIYCKYSQSYLFINDVIVAIKSIVSNKLGKDITLESDIEKDRIVIQEQYLLHNKENSLAIQKPLAAKKWNYEKNGHTTPDMVPSVSKRRYWWKCPTCGNEWQGEVQNIPNTRTCAKCVHASIDVSKLESYSLETAFPEIAKDWDYEKNASLTPNSVTPGSHLKVWWKCQSCGNEWQTTIKARTRNESHCKICSLKQRDKNRISQRGSFGKLHPELVKDWDTSKNGDVTPFDIAEKTKTVYWWKCDKGHSYQMSATIKSRGVNCPICSGKRIIPETSLGGVTPMLLDFWDYEENTISPFEVAPKSGVELRWKCPVCKGKFSRRAFVMQRTCRCPHCGYQNTL